MITRKLGPKRIALLFLTLSFFVSSSLYAQTRPQLDIHQIENLTGAKGEFEGESGLIKVTVPHTELKVNSMGVKLTPALGLASEISFQPLASEVEMTGKVILFEDQVNFALKTALDHDLNITALHNAYLWDAPRVMVLYIEGKGTGQSLATAVGQVFDMIKKTSKGTIWSVSPPPLNRTRSTLDPKTIEAILETKGIALKDGSYKLTWDKTNPIGKETWAVFSGTDKQAALFGDFAIPEDRVQNVLKALLKHNLFIISLHQNSKGDGPKDIVVHYMGRGSLMDLSKALKEALDCLQPEAIEPKNKGGLVSKKARKGQSPT